jgi:transketolase
MVHVAMRAADMLAEKGVAITVVDMPTIKPLDPELAQLARSHKVVVTAENHSIVGGLGSAVAELLMEKGVAIHFRRVGLQDTFAEGGTAPYLFEKYGLSESAIVAAVMELRARA